MMEHQHIVILGAGPCGLGAGYRLGQLGISSFRIFESNDHVGGLSSSFTDNNGFTWDIGGHVFHAHDHRMQDIFVKLLGTAYRAYTRRAEVRIGPHTVSYPFQYSIAQLPQKMQKICMDGLSKRRLHTTPVSFRQWILRTFGTGMANYFFFPYNKKVWRYPLSKMDWRWIDEKVATTHEMYKGTSWGRNATFYVPKNGGIGTIWSTMAVSISDHIVLSKRASYINAHDKVITFDDGSQLSYDHLLSTLPLPALVSKVHDLSLPKPTTLQSCGVYIVGLGIRGAVPEKYRKLHWMYTPSPHVPFFRMSVYSNYGHAPRGCWSLLFEVSYDGKKKPIQSRCVSAVIAKAKKYGYLPQDATLIDQFFYAAPIAYPIPTIGRDDMVSSIITKLSRYGISSLGRFGSWKYEQGNMDQVCLSGIEWAEHIVNTE